MSEYFGIQYEEINVDYLDGKIKTYKFGTGSKVILALPGFPNAGFFYIWPLRLYDLSKITVITFDLPGWIGQSDDIFKNRSHSIQDYLNITEAIIQFYDLKKFSILGYSFGAGLTIALVHKLINKIDRIALVSGVFSHKFMKMGKRHQLLKVAKKLNLHWAFEKFFMTRLKKIVNGILKAQINEEDMARLDEALNNVNSKTLLQDADELFRSDFSDNFKFIDPADLLISYSKDEVPYFQSQAKHVKNIFGNQIAKEIVLEGAHEDFILQPKEADIKAIFDFLSQS